MAYNTIVKGYELPDSYEDLHTNCLACVVVGGTFHQSTKNCAPPEYVKDLDSRPYPSKFLTVPKFSYNMHEWCGNSPSCMKSDYSEDDLKNDKEYKFKVGWHYNTVHKWDHCFFDFVIPRSFKGGINMVPKDTKEVNSFVTLYENLGVNSDLIPI